MRRKFTRFMSLFLVVSMMLFMVFPTAVFAKPDKKEVVNGKIDSVVHLKGHELKAKQQKNLPYGLSKKYMKEEVGPYIIMFAGPIEEPMKQQVEKEGATLVEYIPDFAFLATMTPEVAVNVAALSFVVDVQVYEPAYKINPSLVDEKGNIKGYGDVVVRITTFGEPTTLLDNEVKNAHAKQLEKGKNHITVKMDKTQIAKFAYLNNVKSIEEKPEYTLLNDVAKGIMDVDDVWSLGSFDGTGQVVGICDTGLDTGVNNSTMHLDFQGRIDAIYALGRSTADDTHGHGTHVAGSVLGSGARSNGQIKGMAPNARLVFQSVLDSSGGLGGLPNDLNTLFTQAWNAGARIHTNSWGAASNGDYNIDAQQVDQYVWNNDMIVLFAAGNEGTDANWTKVLYNTIGTPASAKNCITVGASENLRTDKGTYANNANEIVIFSSRGWTEDGRVKPDVVAPGSWILSAKSSKAPDSSFWGTYNTYYAYMGGTSMATPLTAGAVAVARQYMQNQWGITPSPALMKAAIINGATDMGMGVPSKDQGWGRVSLINSLAAKEYKYDDESTSLSTNGTKSYSYAVESANTPLRLSLVWTDYPGSTTASKALVNDLDLTVTAPDGTVYYGNDFTSPYNTSYDRLNNVENVWIATPQVGTYTIQVKGYNVPNGPQPYALFASGNFGTATGGDTTAPTCSLTAPAAGTVSGTVTVSANASDNVGVSRVDFYAGSTLIGTDTTSPYSISWNTTTVANGSYNLTAKAFDAAGNVATSSPVAVTVSNTSSASTITERFTGSVSSSGTASTYFYLDVTDPGTVSLNLSWSATADLDMYLYNPSGTEVARAYTTSNPENISYNATTTGRYKVKVTAYSGSTSFLLSATHNINTSATGRAVLTDTVDKAGTSYKQYSLTAGSTSGTINIELSWTGTADLDVYLYNASGTEVAKSYTTRNPESISYIVPATGNYTIKVVAYSGSATYDLKVTWPDRKSVV